MNVFDHILESGNDDSFMPDVASGATQAPAGSLEKIQEMAERASLGEALWHEDDRDGYDGLRPGSIDPRGYDKV